MPNVSERRVCSVLRAPGQAERRFRGKPNTHSDGSRTAIPGRSNSLKRWSAPRCGRYQPAMWARPKVSIDYHVAFQDHYYSVPYQLRGEVLDLRATTTTVELFPGRPPPRKPPAQPRAD